MKECEIGLVKEELEIIHDMSDRDITPEMFMFFTEGLSDMEQKVIRSDLKNKGICINPGMEEFRQDLAALIKNPDNEDIKLSYLETAILKEKWKLYDLDKPLEKPLSSSEVCDAVHMQPMDYNCGGYESVNGKVLRYLRYKKNRDYTLLFMQHGIIEHGDMDHMSRNKNGDTLSEITGELTCRYSDDTHSQDHIFKLTIHYDCRRIDKNEMMILFAREAKKKLDELGDQEHFCGGIIRFNHSEIYETVSCNVGCENGEFFFYNDREVSYIERDIFYTDGKTRSELIRKDQYRKYKGLRKRKE